MGDEQGVQCCGWVQEEPAGGRVGDEEHLVAGGEAAGTTQADREAQVSVVPDVDRRLRAGDGEDGSGEQSQSLLVNHSGLVEPGG